MPFIYVSIARLQTMVKVQKRADVKLPLRDVIALKKNICKSVSGKRFRRFMFDILLCLVVLYNGQVEERKRE